MTFAQDFSKAKSLFTKGAVPDAIYLYLQLLVRFPKNTKVKKELINIGKRNGLPTFHPADHVLKSLVRAHQNGQTQNAYSEARALNQKFPESSIVSNIYGVLCAELNLFSEAETALKHSLSLNPANPDVCNNLGNINRELRNLNEAIFYYQLAVIFQPKLTMAHVNLGNTFAEKKMFEEARNAFKVAIASNPSSGSAYRYLSQHSEFQKGDPLVQQVSNLLGSDGVKDFDRSELFFAYSKMCEDLGDYDGAFSALKTGGTLKQKVFGYQRSQDEDAFSHYTDQLSKLEKASLPEDDKYAGPLPIFVLGMPRSGTSLVEQIISSHTRVRAGGELPTAELLCRNIFQPNCQPTDADILKFRASYLTKIFQLSDGNSFLTDKMPQNFLHIGVIRKAIPESKIVHVKRDARATCWSNFKHCFQSEQMGFSFDLDDTVAYYLNYQKFMKSVESRFGSDIYTLDYDLLCEDPRSEIAKLLEYLELPSEESCFNPHQNDYVARTASQQQVQKPIYKGSSSGWKTYEGHTREAFKPLKP